MPRHARVSPDGFVQHVINRGDHRETIFHKAADFDAFLRTMAATAERIPMRILAYCIMRNHFHMLLWPYRGDDLPEYMQLLMNTHIQRYLQHYRPPSNGHIYQGRYRNVLVQDGPGVLKVARYIEANPIAAGLVQRAEHYRWSSLSPLATSPDRPVLNTDLVVRTPEWIDFVNQPMDTETILRIQQSFRRGMPFGEDDWVSKVAVEHGLKHTLRDPGRPRSYEIVPL